MEKNKENKENKDIKLTPKQELFCYEYCIDFNATRAAKAAGYSESTANVIGSENLSKPYIQERIKYMKEHLAETAQVSALKVIEEHKKIAFGSMASMHNTWLERSEFEKLTDDQKSCIKSINTKILKKNVGTSECPDIIDVEYVKIELYDKQKSLDSISNMLGFNAPLVNINKNMEICIDDGLDEE